MIWETPPAGQEEKYGRTIRFVKELKARPGEWAKYPTTYCNQATMYQLRKDYPLVEWTQRQIEEGAWQTWARYMGEEAP